MQIVFLEPAQLELEEAVQYYEHEQQGLGQAFLYEILKTIDRVRNFPSAWQRLSRRTRRCRTRRFPFGVVYQERKEEILIVAIAHLHRKPEYWKDRLGKK